MRRKNAMCEIEIGFIMSHYGYINIHPFQGRDKGCLAAFPTTNIECLWIFGLHMKW